MTVKLRYAGLILILSLIVGGDALRGQDAPQGERIELWKGQAPIGDGQFEEKETWITVHPAPEPNGTAIVICPGGGYGGLVTGAEGHGIAKWLNGHGITGIVLEYRLPAGRSFVPLYDAQRAIRTVRLEAPKWKIDPSKIGIMGFSAGGHLASTAATHFSESDPQGDEGLKEISCRPDFAILIYPVITMNEKTHGGSKTNLLGENPSEELIQLFSNELQITPKTPPVFLAHAQDDEAVGIHNSIDFYNALLKQKVPGKLLELPSGGHGLNGYQGPMWDAWQEQSLQWLKELKITQ
ncbi:alpha/beta hydrolase [Schlesneria sp. DSM 10557]|uniref:alpha/beta hydrolase n=1 Tax=Schlesneria sp. DSM 10557 TaxID=3044399 RepID=UPI0035A10486